MISIPRQAVWAALAVSLLAGGAAAQDKAPRKGKPAPAPAFPSATPSALTAVVASLDHVRRPVSVPLRDGVTLPPVILVPRRAKRPPMLLTRTPYDASSPTTHPESAHLGPSLQGYDNAP